MTFNSIQNLPISSFVAIIPMTPWEATAKFFQNGYSVEKYVRIYDEAKARNAAIWPPYNQLKEVKNSCLPDNIRVSANEVICPMQSYLDSQAFWLLDNPFLMEEIQNFARDPSIGFRLVSKGGPDGSGNQSVNRWGDHPGSLFATSMAPVQLQAFKGSEYAVLWTNPRANSPVGHGYVRLAFEKELKGT